MTRCNNCERIFLTEKDIPFLIGWENGKVKLYEAGKMYKSGGEVFRGCPHCMTDEYLMDMDDGDIYSHIKTLVKWLESHNKNYTKEQYHKISDLNEILNHISCSKE